MAQSSVVGGKAASGFDLRRRSDAPRSIHKRSAWFPEMIAEWAEPIKKYTEQAESQNDNLAEDKELCALKQSAEVGIKTRSKEYAAMLRKIMWRE